MTIVKKLQLWKLRRRAGGESNFEQIVRSAVLLKGRSEIGIRGAMAWISWRWKESKRPRGWRRIKKRRKEGGRERQRVEKR